MGETAGTRAVRIGARVGACALALTAVMLLAGCAGPTPAYVELENSIKKSIIADDQRPVSSVACLPHVKDVSYSDGFVHLNCFVRFPDGTSYSTQATIEARSYQVEGLNFEFDEPGPLDITTAPLPRPTVSVGAASAGSLFYARNLRKVVTSLAGRFTANDLILKMALYPGEAIAVIGADGQAQLVTAHNSGALTVGPETSFDGRRSGIEISQLDPAVPQRLAMLIAKRGGVPVSKLDRFVLALPGDLADWQIYPTSGQTWFRAHILGDALKQISPDRTRSLN